MTDAAAVTPDLWLLLRVFVALIVVLALAVIVLRWVLPRFAGSLGLAGRATVRRLGVVEVRSLDREHRLALIEVERPTGRCEVLMAYGGGGATLLDSWHAKSSNAGEEKAAGS